VEGSHLSFREGSEHDGGVVVVAVGVGYDLNASG